MLFWELAEGYGTSELEFLKRLWGLGTGEEEASWNFQTFCGG